MIRRVIDAKHEHDFIIHLKFSDGTEGEVDLEEELYGAHVNLAEWSGFRSGIPL